MRKSLLFVLVLILQCGVGLETGKNRRFPTAVDLRHLALMDFLLEHFEEIQRHWWLSCVRLAKRIAWINSGAYNGKTV
jgi:hypothetical protein